MAYGNLGASSYFYRFKINLHQEGVFFSFRKV
jgi:hypothetical protein